MVYFAGAVFCFFIIDGYMSTIPRELIEAAKIDGASVVQIYARIMMPLSIPVLATVAIFQTIGLWNDFLVAETFLSSSSKYTIVLQVYNSVGPVHDGLALIYDANDDQLGTDGRFLHHNAAKDNGRPGIRLGKGLGARTMGTELYRDPVFDGATDPMVIFNRAERTWWMLYTSRRTTAPGAGVAWVHGTDIGVASLMDGRGRLAVPGDVGPRVRIWPQHVLGAGSGVGWWVLSHVRQLYQGRAADLGGP